MIKRAEKTLQSWLRSPAAHDELICFHTIVNFATYSRNAASMGTDNAKEVRKQIIQVHSVLLAILIGALFAQPARDEYVKLPISAVVIAVSVLWVLYIYQSWSGYPTVIDANGPNGLTDQFNERSTELSALVAGVLGYLCKKEHPSNKRSPSRG